MKDTEFKEELNEETQNNVESNNATDNAQENELTAEEQLQKQLYEANEKVATLEDKYLRQVAEFDKIGRAHV